MLGYCNADCLPPLGWVRGRGACVMLVHCVCIETAFGLEGVRGGWVGGWGDTFGGWGS